MERLLQLYNMTDEPMQLRYLQINKHHWNGDYDYMSGLILTDDTEIVIRKINDKVCDIYRRKIE